MSDSAAAADRQSEWSSPAGPPRPRVVQPPVSSPAARDLFPLQALTNALWLSAVVTFVVAAWVLLDRHGWDYYTTPLGVRGYHPVHRLLRPSGPIGHLLGICGWLMMFVPVAYMVRKRVRALQRMGSLKAWLETHIFCGIVGPVLVTFHTSFKFNGIISVAYWSMTAVSLSGFVGRYLYVRIPKTMRGVELSRGEVQRSVSALKDAVAAQALAGSPRHAIERFERDTLPLAERRFGEWRVRLRLRALGRDLRALGVPDAAVRDVVQLLRTSAALSSRLRSLGRTQRLFALWHVFHLPLVWVMFGIVTLHVGLALYLGYWPSFR